MSPLLSTPCLSSSPSLDLLPPFLSLSFLSSAQTLRATICPQLQPGERREIPLCQVCCWCYGGGVSGGAGSLQGSSWSGIIQPHTQQIKHRYVIVLIQARLLNNPPDWPASLTLAHSVSEFPSDQSGHISASSLLCASCSESCTFTGRVLLPWLGQVELLINRSG